jgi:hypothetical protein
MSTCPKFHPKNTILSDKMITNKINNNKKLVRQHYKFLDSGQLLSSEDCEAGFRPMT